MTHVRTVPKAAPRNIGAEDLLRERMTQVGAMIDLLQIAASRESTYQPSEEIIHNALWGIQALHAQAEAAREAALNLD